MGRVGVCLTGIIFPYFFFLLKHVPLDQFSKYHCNKTTFGASLTKRKQKLQQNIHFQALKYPQHIKILPIAQKNKIQPPTTSPTSSMTEPHAFPLTTLTKNVYSVEKFSFPKPAIRYNMQTGSNHTEMFFFKLKLRIKIYVFDKDCKKFC